MNRFFYFFAIFALAINIAACDDGNEARGDVEEPEDIDTDTFGTSYNEFSYPVCFVACDANYLCNTMFQLSFIDMEKCILNSCNPNDQRWRCDAECADNAYLEKCSLWDGCVASCNKDSH